MRTKFRGVNRLLAVFFLLTLTPSSAFAQTLCPWTEFLFEKDSTKPLPESVAALKKQIAEITDQTGKIRLYGYLPEDAAGASEATKHFDARAQVIRELLTDFLNTHEGWILASERMTDTDAPNKRSHASIDVEFHGYDDPLVHDYDVIDNTRALTSYTRVPIRYVRQSLPLYPGGRRLLTQAIRNRDPNQVFVRISAHAETREAQGPLAAKKLSDERLRQVVVFLRELGIPEQNFVLAQSFGSAEFLNEPAERLVMVTFLQKDLRPAPVARPASAPRAIASLTTVREVIRDRPESGWQGQFGVASGTRLFMVGVAAEKRMGPHWSLGGMLGQVERLGGTVEDRSRAFVMGATATGYLFDGWEGPWAKFTLLSSFYHFRGLTGRGEFAPGLRGDIGVTAQRGLPFSVRGSLGTQYLSRSSQPDEVGGWSPTFTVELGFNW